MTSKEKMKILTDILKMDTTGGNETVVANYILNLFSPYPKAKVKKIEYAPGRDQLIVDIEGGAPGKKLGLSGHMDVVPVGDAPWMYPPFSATEAEGKIYARGASDMKGGLAAIVCAMLELLEEETEFPGSIRLLASVGEETAAIGARQLVELGHVADLDGIIIAEGTGFFVASGHKGALWVRIVTNGKTAHGSTPEMGINAVNHMLLFIDAFHKKMDFTQYQDAFTGPSTCALTVLEGGKATNVVPDRCVAEFDIRTVRGQSHEEMKKQIQSILDELTETVKDFSGTMEVINDLSSVYTNQEDPLVKIVCEEGSRHRGAEVKPLGSTGYTDASWLVTAKENLPIVIFGPGNPFMAHQPNEWIEVEEYLASVDSFKKIALQYVSLE